MSITKQMGVVSYTRNALPLQVETGEGKIKQMKLVEFDRTGAGRQADSVRLWTSCSVGF